MNIILFTAAGILGDKLSYLPGEGEPIYERRADMRELLARQALQRGQEVRQVRHQTIRTVTMRDGGHR